MTDHYIAFLEEQAQLLKRHLKAARAQRDDALTEAAIFGLVLAEVLQAHEGCTADWCPTMAAIQGAGL